MQQLRHLGHNHGVCQQQHSQQPLAGAWRCNALYSTGTHPALPPRRCLWPPAQCTVRSVLAAAAAGAATATTPAVVATSGKPQTQKPRRVHAAAGTTAGVLATMMLHPLDVVKVRFQVNDGIAKNVPTYRSAFHALRTIHTAEGSRALYQGLTPAVVGSGTSWGLYFFFYENAKQRRQRKREALGEDVGGTLDVTASALEGGMITVMFTNPIWLVKTRMQLQIDSYEAKHGEAPPRRYTSMTRSLAHILRTDGPLGLYRGLVPAMLLTSHGAVQFGFYEAMKRLVTNYDELNSAYYFVIGAASKVAAATATYPAQVIKARLMQDAEVTGTLAYAGLVRSFVRTVRQEGFRGLYKGLSANLMRGVMNSAIVLVSYEKIADVLSKAQVFKPTPE